MKRIEYTGNYDGEPGFTSSYLIGKEVLSVVKDGVASSKIITDTPVGKQVKFLVNSGSITFGIPLVQGEESYVLFQDL